MSIRLWLSGPLPREVRQALERLERQPDVVHVAVMPDVHLAEDVCVGTVLATRRRIYPAAVGGDIGCGMAALRFDGEAADLDAHAAARILAGLSARVPAMRHRQKQEFPPELEAMRLSDPALEKLASREGRVEFATLGRGNHFVELQEDDDGRLWLMLHSGSRAMGQAIRDHHLRRASHDGGFLPSLEAETEAGEAYLADLAWALAFAEASRRAMAGAVAEVVADVLGFSAETESLVTCHHNHVQREEHFGEQLLVHRKGAIPAGEGVPGVIPGSMGTESFHVTGRGHPEALCSASHGAGRLFSRSEARRRIPVRTLAREMQGIWYDHRLSERLRDEAPSAYKDVRAVLRAEADLVKVERILRPRLSYKGT